MIQLSTDHMWAYVGKTDQKQWQTIDTMPWMDLDGERHSMCNLHHRRLLSHMLHV